MLNDRRLSEYELRLVLSQREVEIKRLRDENEQLRSQVSTLTKWNVAWQKHRWNQELIRRSEGLEKEFKGLSDVQTKLLLYLANATGKESIRHVRGIAKQLGLDPATACINLKVLQQKKLIRAYLFNSNRKKYYALPETLQFINN